MPGFAWKILAALGVVDLIRGVMHTYLSAYAATNIAGLDLSQNGQNLLVLMGAFGISNFLTGAIFLLVAVKARPLVPAVLGLIPLAYVVGLIGVRLNASPQAAFPGRYMMVVYLLVCVGTYAACQISARKHRRNAAPRAGTDDFPASTRDVKYP